MTSKTLPNLNPIDLHPPEPPDRRRTFLSALLRDGSVGGGEPLSPRAAKKVFSESEDYFDGFPMRIFKWSPEFNPKIESSIVPVWIRFPELPVHLFQKKALFGIASLIGSPLKIDEATADGIRLSVARVCVEIDLMNPQPSSIWVGTEGRYYAQTVTYERIPKYCSHCRHLGHGMEQCREGREKDEDQVHPTEEEIPDLRALFNRRKRKNVAVPNGEQNEAVTPSHPTVSQQIPAPKGAPVPAPSVGNQNSDTKTKQSNSMPNLETVDSLGEKSVQGNPTNHDYGEEEHMQGFDLADRNPIRTICVFDPTCAERDDNDIEGLGNVSMMGDVEGEDDTNQHFQANNSTNEAVEDDFIEAKVKDPRQHWDENSICRRFNFGSMIRNCNNKIWCLLAESIKYEVLRDEEQFLYLQLQVPFRNDPILCTIVYAKCDKVARGAIWDFMRSMSDQTTPWFIGGDFNSVISVSERSNGVYPSNHSIEEFNEAIFDSGLLDVGFEGSQYTWTDHRLWQRLGRVLFASEWIDAFPHTSVHHLPRSSSDHCPILVRVRVSTSSGPSSFRFQNMCFRHPNFMTVVQDSWNQPSSLTGMLRLAEKLQRLKACLKQWNKEIFGNIFDQLSQAEESVRQAERKYDEEPTDLNLMAMNLCTAKLQRALTIEEDFWRQKSACKWALEGERNTGYFHSLVQHEEAPLNIIPNLINEEQGLNLYKETSIDEMSKVVFDMAAESTAGPDGFNASFYQRCWEIVKFDVTEAAKDFLDGTPLPISFTATTIVLIPSGFVPKRLIGDNILLAQEIMHSIAANKIDWNVALKLDMAKAYDTVNWNFLELILQKLGFPKRTIVLIRNCTNNCWFSILINGVLSGFFKSTRGLRQGDPLSPTLFVLAAEYLSRGLNNLFITYKSLAFKGSEGISHLAYADDVIIFTNSNAEGLRKIMNFLHDFEKKSGQCISIVKSSFIVSPKTPLLIKRHIKRITGFVLKPLPFTDLGAPIFVGRKKSEYYERLIEAMGSKIGGWEKKFLSYGSRLLLIKSVLLSMPIHLLLVTKPPKGVLDRIERMLNKFFWGSSGTTKRIHWSSWSRIGCPVAEGGLGVRQLTDTVSAFTHKLWWHFRTSSSLWSEFLNKKYCKRSCPSSSKSSSTSSPLWRRLKNAQNAAENNIYWSIRCGALCFWHDNWLVAMKIADISFDEEEVDRPWWKGQSDGAFSVKSAWNLVRMPGIRRPLLNELWHPIVMPSMSIFSWRLLNNFIPVDARLKEKGMVIVSKCCCCENIETIEHLFLNSSSVKEVWIYFGNLFKLQPPQTDFISIMFHFWKLSSPYVKRGHVRLLIPLLIFWFTWTMRNEAKSNDVRFTSSAIIRRVMAYLWKLYKAKCFKLVHWRGDQTNTFAELYGVSRGLHFAWELGCHNVWVELDAIAIIRIILTEKGNWRLQSLLTSIRMFKRKMHIHFTHVYRKLINRWIF
ncbi:UNVERIFIED_CONTAM: hypothetical protein Slati_1833700 [Sesamum latifolium]|uniref:Reverse transcriptase domain-containing protein n=1 Tax=Sesamum latifolium TaxID=2727402 RepID=A0AAW2WZT4_9LAMI